MSAINRVPTGLQSLLGTKALGQNPRDLGQQVQPTLDLIQNYIVEQGLETVQVLDTPLTPSAFGRADPVVIPAGEAWLVRNVTFHLTGIANPSTYQAAGTYEVPSFSDPLSAAALTPATAASVLPAGEAFSLAAELNPAVLFPADTQFFLSFYSGTGSVTVRTNVTFARLLI